MPRAGPGHNRELARRIDLLESKYDGQFKVVFDAIRELMSPAAQTPNEQEHERWHLTSASLFLAYSSSPANLTSLAGARRFRARPG